MRARARDRSLTWLLVAVVIWCFLLLAVTPADAKPVSRAFASGPNSDSITLHDEQGEICPKDSQRATYFIFRTQETVEGCYVIREGVVHLGFIDGDRASFPVNMFKPLGMAPQSGPGRQPGVGPGQDSNGTPQPLNPIIAQRGGAKVARWM